MARPRKNARPYLRKARGDRGSTWVILDGSSEISTGCSEEDRAGAEAALGAYLSSKHQPPPKAQASLRDILISHVVDLYRRERAPRTKSAAWIAFMADPVIDWWGAKTLADVNASTCTEYLDWRLDQGVSVATPRHELKCLRAAIRYFHASKYGPLPSVPIITLPPKPPARTGYFLTRQMVAQRIRAARRLRYTGHIVRLILLGIYTGTRPGATLRLRWVPSIDGGWVDVDGGVIHRRGDAQGESRKRQPPVRIHQRPLPHLRRWRDADMSKGCTYCVSYYGKRIEKLLKGWKAVAIEAGHGRRETVDGEEVWVVDDAPHVLRHTCATWTMQSGVDLYEAAGYLGMSPETLWDTYGHHHPDFQQNAARATGKRSAQGTPKKPPANSAS